MPKISIVLATLLALAALPAAWAAEAARVNGSVIPEGAVQLELAREPELRYHPNVTAEKLAVYRKAALQRLVEQEVSYPEAVRRNAAPSAKEVAEGVARGEKGMGGRDKLVADLAKGGLTIKDFENWIRKSMALEALTTKVKSEMTVSQDEVAGYYHAHEAEYRQPERVVAEMLYFPVAPYATTAETEGVRAKAAATAEQWRREKPKDAAAFAAQAGAQFKDMGIVHKGAAIEGIDEALFGQKPGGVSAPAKTIYGFHVVHVKETKPERQMPLEEASAGIRAKLLEQRGEERYSKLMAELLAGAKIVKPN